MLEESITEATVGVQLMKVTTGGDQFSLFSDLNLSVTQKQCILSVPLHQHICISFRYENRDKPLP